jgi:hypothetical protein
LREEEVFRDVKQSAIELRCDSEIFHRPPLQSRRIGIADLPATTATRSLKIKVSGDAEYECQFVKPPPHMSTAKISTHSSLLQFRVTPATKVSNLVDRARAMEKSISAINTGEAELDDPDADVCDILVEDGTKMWDTEQSY